MDRIAENTQYHSAFNQGLLHAIDIQPDKGSCSTIITSEVIDGRSCYKLKGKENLLDKDGYVMIWISKVDYLIRKIEVDRKINDFRVKTTFLITPYTLKVENKDLFRFQPDRKVAL